MQEEEDADRYLFEQQRFLGDNKRSDVLDDMMVERGRKAAARASRWELLKGIAFGAGLVSTFLGLVSKGIGWW